MISNEDDLATEPFPAQEPWEHQIAALEQELRETASELEKTRALLQRAQPGSANPLTWKEWKALAQGEPVEDPRLAEATALLERCLFGAGEVHGHIRDEINAFLSSRAPAQPAAPTPDVPWDTENPGRCSECDPSFGCFDGSAPCSKTPYEQPAAPEPSATVIAGLQKLGNGLLQRAESAEAKLAAVRLVVLRLRKAREPVDPQLIVEKLDQALTTAPSPGAGEKT